MRAGGRSSETNRLALVRGMPVDRIGLADRSVGTDSGEVFRRLFSKRNDFNLGPGQNGLVPRGQFSVSAGVGKR